jgi:hypothetical protein
MEYVVGAIAIVLVGGLVAVLFGRAARLGIGNDPLDGINTEYL